MHALHRLPKRILALIVLAMLAAAPAAIAHAQSLEVSPSVIEVAPGQTVGLTARAQSSRFRWIVRGPRSSGADWGRLEASGGRAQYTAPRTPPSGPIVVQVQLLGAYGEPIASVDVPVRFAGAAHQRPASTPRSRPPPSRGGVDGVLAALDAGRQMCRRGDARRGVEVWQEAQADWNDLGLDRRREVVRGFLRNQLDGTRFSDDISADVVNIARVTGSGSRIRVVYSGDFTRNPPYRTPFHMPLTISPRIAGFPYRTALHFFCYEGEVMRVRHQIRNVCQEIGDAIAADVQSLPTPVTQADYDRFMDRYRGGRERDRLALSWMFERIAAEEGRFDSSCDMSLAASHPSNYDRRFAGVTFLHDVVAEEQGRRYCACP